MNRKWTKIQIVTWYVHPISLCLRAHHWRVLFLNICFVSQKLSQISIFKKYTNKDLCYIKLWTLVAARNKNKTENSSKEGLEQTKNNAKCSFWKLHTMQIAQLCQLQNYAKCKFYEGKMHNFALCIILHLYDLNWCIILHAISA